MRALAQQVLVILAVLVGLSGCAANLTKPQTLEQSLLYAQAQVGAAYRTVGDLAQRKQITRDKALDLVAEIDRADVSIKTARTALAAGDPTTAQTKLDAALALLLTIESALGGAR
jgi:uncharacterized protein YceK